MPLKVPGFSHGLNGSLQKELSFQMIYWRLSNSLPASCNGVFPYMSGGFLFLENSMNRCQMSIRLSCLAASINFSWGVSLQKPVSASTDCLQALHTDLHLIKVAQSIMLNIILAMWGAFFPEITKGNVDFTWQFIFTLVNGDVQSQCCHVEPKYIWGKLNGRMHEYLIT